MSASPILQTFALGDQWPTIDPFLFCVHHLDHYPASDGQMGPAASLEGRQIGSDFSSRDGWSMYHGTHVPGFPSHPHRGFETLTYVRRGLVDHSDSLGAAARYGRGDAQWLTAGRGIVHSEMFPLLDLPEGNTLELFQIWVNLAASDKMAEPHFSMFWADDIPKVETIDDQGRAATVTVVAGSVGDATAPAPPPSSWASRDDSDVAVWHVVLEPGASVELAAATHFDTRRVAYLFEGDQVMFDGHRLDRYSGAVVDCSRACRVEAGDDAVELLVLQGRPIGEPVASYGPFVMNNRAEIQQAFDDYQATGFGGWPWPSSGPVHGTDPARFARQGD